MQPIRAGRANSRRHSLIFPWFGKPAGQAVQHGFARNRDWELKEIHSPADAPTRRALRPAAVCGVGRGPDHGEYVVQISAALTAD